MFIDEVKIKVISGKGGDGLISWRREKYIPKGGPWGGDGGKGGDVYLQTTNNLNTLSEYRNKKVLEAQDGKKGGTNTKAGLNGEDLVLKVPVGSIIKNSKTTEILADLKENNLKFLVVKGGRGGYGNAHFVSSTRQAPSFAELGDISQEKDLLIELKLVADVGIIGIPSSGKSTLIGSITNVKPKIGDYPFTTITPNLGVLEYKKKTVVLADVPGLIPGASSGKGLGIKFLKHIERTRFLIHLLDLYRLDKIFEDYRSIRKELEIFSKSLNKKEEIVILSKSDLLEEDMKKLILGEFKKKFKSKKIFMVSSITGEGIERLKDYLVTMIDSVFTEMFTKIISKKTESEEIKIYDLKNKKSSKKMEVDYLGSLIFRVNSERLEQIVRMTDFTNKEAIMRVYDVIEKMGILKKIEKQLKKILEKQNLDDSFLFEGSKKDEFLPKIIVGEKTINILGIDISKVI